MSIAPPVYPTLTALPLPAVSTFPSERCIQWSDDGQAVLLTRQAIFILTPALGVNVELSSVVKQTPDNGATANAQKQIGWLRTMIEWDRSSNVYNWAMECQDWGTVSLGSLDLSLVGVACSPSNVTVVSGCVFAVLDSNMEVTLYKPVKNYLTGKWQKIGTLAKVLDEAAEIHDQAENARPLRVLNKQVTSIAWSSQPDFAVSPSPKFDASLLAVGTNAGTVMLLRYKVENEDEVDFLTKVEVQERRIIHLAWSPWKTTSPRQAQALLACAIADGSIVTVRISQDFEPSDTPPSLPFGFRVSVAQQCIDQVLEATRRSTGALRWIDTPGSLPVLVFSKPGLIYFWRPSGPTWQGLRTIVLEKQELSAGSTALACVSGIAYIQRQDAIVVSLSDGSFHVIGTISIEPRLVSDSTDTDLSSRYLSMAARQHFVAVEGDEMRKVDVNCTHGMTTFDDDSTIMWIHEALRPTDFNYKHDAKHTNKVVLAQLWGGEPDRVFLETVEDVLFKARDTSGRTPQAALRKIYLRLQDPDTLAELSPHLLETLKRASADEPSQLELSILDAEVPADFRRRFCSSLYTHIFGSHSLRSQRLQVSLSTFCEQQSREQPQKDAYRVVTAYVIHTLWGRTLKILMRHFLAVIGLLTPKDVPFIWRIIVQAMLPGMPQDVQAEAAALSAEVTKLVPAAGESAHLDLDELCPACHARVPLTDINYAVCPHGHHWPRCSITSFLLSTPMVRTCVGCSRKAFLPSRPDLPASVWLPPTARTWLLEDLLDTVRRCFFCGSGFVTLV